MEFRVLGLNAFKQIRKDLKEIDDKAPRELGKVNRQVAKFVVGEARGKAQSLGGVFKKSAPAVTASGGSSAVAVFLSKANRPYAFGAEFGSKKFKQFKPWRGNQHVDAFAAGPGYFLFPAIRENESEIVDMWKELADDLLATIKDRY